MIGNPERGEATLRVGQDTYALKLSMNAAVALEAKTHKTLGEVLAECSKLDAGAIRSVVWLLLQKHHAAAFTTEEAVGDLIDDAGGIQAMVKVLGEALAVNMPKTGGVTDPPDAVPPTTH